MNRNSEPQKDSPPNPPPGGEASNVVEVEGWQAFETAFAADGDPIVRVSIAKQLFAALTADEKRRLVAAAKGLIAWRRRQKRPPGKPSAQTFIRETDAWANWQKYAPPDPVVREPPVFIADGSADWRALCVLARICDDPEPVARMVADHGLGLLRSKPLSEAMRALGQAFDLESGEWPIVEDGSQQCGAWCAFVGIKPFNLFTGEVVQKEIMPGKTVAWKVAKFGLRVPWLWPPRKDGSLSLAASAMPVANHEMSDQGE